VTSCCSTRPAPSPWGTAWPRPFLPIGDVSAEALADAAQTGQPGRRNARGSIHRGAGQAGVSGCGDAELSELKAHFVSLLGPHAHERVRFSTDASYAKGRWKQYDAGSKPRAAACPLISNAIAADIAKPGRHAPGCGRGSQGARRGATHRTWSREASANVSRAFRAMGVRTVMISGRQPAHRCRHRQGSRCGPTTWPRPPLRPRCA